MTALAFDTHKAVKALKHADFTERRAEAITATIFSTFTTGVTSRRPSSDSGSGSLNPPPERTRLSGPESSP